MELTEMRENFKIGVFGSFETLLDAYLTDPKGFTDGEAVIFDKCCYQIKTSGSTPEVNQVIMDKFADELMAYYENLEILKILNNL